MVETANLCVTYFCVTYLFLLQLTGLLSISSKFLPTVMNLLKRLAEEAQGGASGGTEAQNPSATSQAFRNQTPRPEASSISHQSSTVSSVGCSDGDSEYSTTNLTHRHRTVTQETELS